MKSWSELVVTTDGTTQIKTAQNNAHPGRTERRPTGQNRRYALSMTRVVRPIRYQ